MERDGIIATVTTPTKWISNMVTVKRPDKLRVCIDPRDLNHAIRRPHFPMRTIEDVTPRLANSKVYSVADAKDGFLQIELDKESSYLTTFWAPQGRYRWLRMPFGISSAPEEFSRQLSSARRTFKCGGHSRRHPYLWCRRHLWGSSAPPTWCGVPQTSGKSQSAQSQAQQKEAEIQALLCHVHGSHYQWSGAVCWPR